MSLMVRGGTANVAGSVLVIATVMARPAYVQGNSCSGLGREFLNVDPSLPFSSKS